MKIYIIIIIIGVLGKLIADGFNVDPDLQYIVGFTVGGFAFEVTNRTQG